MNMIGTVVAGRYEVKSRIGSGGTSSVYLVTDRHIGRTLAMKVINVGTQGALRFARSEIESLRRVRFELFPAIHDAFADGGYIYMISDYVRGRCLWDMTKGRGMDRRSALNIASHICRALDYLHTLDEPILYLDLKPENIIIDEEGLPHLIDFGIAGLLMANRIPIGTRGYSPPEQYRRDVRMDVTADIYAFGMTYYAIRCGIPPDPDHDKARADIASSSVLGRSEKTFLAGCTAFSPLERYADAQEVLTQIKHIRSGPYRIRRKIVYTAVAAGILILGTAAAEKIIKTRRQNKASLELVEKATAHMEGGQYTPQAIGVIKAYINSKSLPAECEQKFMFEVAMNAMLISKDYATAQTYFSKLDKDDYPEAEDYMRLCHMERSFDHDPEESIRIVSKLFSDIYKRSPSKEKYENLIFIACCFEKYEEDSIEGLTKYLSVLKMAADEIDGLTAEDKYKNDDEMAALRERIDALETVGRDKMAVRKQNKKMIGDNNENNKDDD